MRTDCTILYLSCISSVKCNPKWSSYFHGNIRWHLGYTRSASIIGSSPACKWLTCSLFRWAYRAIMYNTSYSLWPTLPLPLCPYSASAVLPSLRPDPLAPASPQASHHHRAPGARRLCSLAALLLTAASSPSFPRSSTGPPRKFHGTTVSASSILFTNVRSAVPSFSEPPSLFRG